MRSVTLSFSTAELNTSYANAVLKTTTYSYTEPKGSSLGTYTFVRFPKQMQIVNKTGVDIEFALIGDDEEATFTASPSGFGWVLVPNNGTFSLGRLFKTRKMTARAVAGSGASSALRVDLFPLFGKDPS